MGTRLLVIGIPLASVLSSACVPIIGRVPRYPAIYGVLESEGEPLAGATIVYSHTWPGDLCASERLVATTDSRGHFEFPGESDLVRFYPILYTYDPLLPWSICIEQAEGLSVLHHDYSTHRSHERVVLTCAREMGCREFEKAK